MRKKWLPIVLITAALVACSQKDTVNDGTEDTASPVEVAEVVQHDLVIEKQFYGVMRPETTTPIMPPTTGEIKSLKVEKGDKVEAGDLIATLKTADGRGTIDIEATAAGEITMLAAGEGGFVTGTEPLATIVNLSSVIAKLTIPAEEIPLFEERQKADVTVETLGYQKAVDIGYVSAVPDDTGLYPVELTIDNEGERLRPGMAVVVRLPEKTVEDTLLIPTAALMEEKDKTFVYIVNDDKAIEVPVTVTEIQSDLTAIEGQLQAGDMVVTKGQLTLTDGGKVSIMEEGK